MDPTGMTLLQLTRSVRSLRRLRQMAQVLTQHGFGHIVSQLGLARYVPVWMLGRQVTRQGAEEGASAIARRLVEVCVELGPTYVKFGQMMSTRSDLLPPDFVRELGALQDEVPPFDTETARAIISEELGRPAESCFAWIDDHPLASGSIGQVYRARSTGGADLVVKVRRPGIEQTITLDIQVLKWLAQSLEAIVPEVRIYRPQALVAELEHTILRELDYVNEASSTARFAEAFADHEGVKIPRVYWELTGPRVLALEALRGTNVERLCADTGSGVAINRSLVARRLTECYLRQVFELGVFHADPHPGNILVDPPGMVGLIDFGQVGSISDELMTQLVVMVYAAVGREVDVVVDSLRDLGALGPRTDREGLTRALRGLLDKYYGLPLKRLQLNVLLNEFTDVIRRHDVVIPREAFTLIKAVAMVASVAGRLDPDLDMLSLLQDSLRKTLRQRLSPARLTRDAGVWGWHLISIARSAPGQIRDIMRSIATGGWRMHVEHENLDRITRELDRSSNRLAFSIVIAAIIVGSSVVVSAGSELQILHIRVQHLGVVGYVVAGILGLGLSWAIYRSGRLH